MKLSGHDFYVPPKLNDSRFQITNVVQEPYDGYAEMIWVEIQAEEVTHWDDDAETIRIHPGTVRNFRISEEAELVPTPPLGWRRLVQRTRTLTFSVEMSRLDEFRAAEYIWVHVPESEMP